MYSQVLSVDKTQRSHKAKNLFFRINVFAVMRQRKKQALQQKVDAVRRCVLEVMSVILLQKKN